MNILMVNYEYPPMGGGGGVFNKLLAEELSKNNNITLITSRFNNQKPYEIINNVEIYRVPVLMRTDKNAATIVSMLSFFPACLLAGYNIQKKIRFDLVHSGFAIPSAPSGIILAKRLRIPHILSIFGGDIYDPSKKLSPHKTPILHYTVKKVMEKSDKVVALSSDVMKRAIDYYNISRKINIIHLGIEEPAFNSKNRGENCFKEDDLLLIAIGRIVRRKAIHELIKLVKNVNNPKIKLLIIGDGPERPQLEALAGSLMVSDNISFYGNVSDEKKFSLLNISDIYVSSSQHEGFGLVFLEAMAAGIPVVCYDEGGQVDFLVNNKTGFLVKNGDLEQLALRINELCENQTLRKSMGDYNKINVENYYIEACARKYGSIYDEAIIENRRNRKIAI